MQLVAPAREVVRYEKKYINNDVNATNPYKGPPRPELDDAWHDLFICKLSIFPIIFN